MRMEDNLPAIDGGASLDAEGLRIEQLLTEVRAKAGPTLAPRIDELVQRLLALYGAGLGRLMNLLHESQGLAPALRTAIGTDALLSNLLLLHDLHPFDVRERVEQALLTVGARAPAELLAIDGERVRLRLSGDPSRRAQAEQLVRAAIAEWAPEITAVEFQVALVQLGVCQRREELAR
jgi:hypothetical protein